MRVFFNRIHWLIIKEELVVIKLPVLQFLIGLSGHFTVTVTLFQAFSVFWRVLIRIFPLQSQGSAGDEGKGRSGIQACISVRWAELGLESCSFPFKLLWTPRFPPSGLNLFMGQVGFACGCLSAGNILKSGTISSLQMMHKSLIISFPENIGLVKPRHLQCLFFVNFLTFSMSALLFAGHKEEQIWCECCRKIGKYSRIKNKIKVHSTDILLDNYYNFGVFPSGHFFSMHFST